MHEYSLVEALLRRVEAEAKQRGASRVERVSVRIGDLAGVERGLFATAFETFTAHTICEGAALEIVPVAAEWRCPRCESSRRRTSGRSMSGDFPFRRQVTIMVT